MFSTSEKYLQLVDGEYGIYWNRLYKCYIRKVGVAYHSSDDIEELRKK